VDIRVIAATNVDLRAALEQGRFREDLYYRLNVMPINIPPLRERIADIPLLAESFLQRCATANDRSVPRLSAEAMAKLTAWRWPGNVRELENIIERAVLLARGDEICADDIRLDPPHGSPRESGGGFLPPGLSLEQYEQELIREAMRRCSQNKSQAARMLGLTRNALRYRLDQMGMGGAPDGENDQT
jgi:DNA-binding NtrC family response regulator